MPGQACLIPGSCCRAYTRPPNSLLVGGEEDLVLLCRQAGAAGQMELVGIDVADVSAGAAPAKVGFSCWSSANCWLAIV